MPPPPAPAGRPPLTSGQLGTLGEDIAVRYLTDHGFRVLDRNWRHARGELDVVAREADALVFCEVKTRRGTGYGVPAEAVTAAKRRRLRTLSGLWLQTHDEHAAQLRFDVVAVLTRPGCPAQVTHHRAAF